MSQKRTGIMCVLCDRQGIHDSEMLSNTGLSGTDGAMMLQCTGFGHKIERNQLMAMKPRMKQLRINEKQPPSTIQQAVWVHPLAWQRLTEKYPNNLLTTIASLLATAADDSTMIIEGNDAREMQAMARTAGITLTRSRDFLALLRTTIELSRQIEELRIQQRVLEPFMKMMGAAGVAMQSGENPLAGVIQQGVAANEPQAIPPRSHQAAPIQFNNEGEAFDDNGNYIEQDDTLAAAPMPAESQPQFTPSYSAAPQQQQPPRSTGRLNPVDSFASARRPTGLPTPTPQRDR